MTVTSFGAKDHQGCAAAPQASPPHACCGQHFIPVHTSPTWATRSGPLPTQEQTLSPASPPLAPPPMEGDLPAPHPEEGDHQPLCCSTD